MKSMTIAEAREAPGQVIPRIEGVMEKVWDPKIVNGKNGEVSVQNGTLRDETGSIKFTLWGHQADLGARGRRFFFESVVNSKGMLSGVRVKENSFTNKKGELIEEVILEVGGGATFGIVGAQPPKPTEMPPTPPPSVKLDDTAGVRRRLMQFANLQILAGRAANYAAGALGETDPEQIAKLRISFFIQAARENLADALPAKPLVNDPKKPEDKEWRDEPTEPEEPESF